ncbi:MAG: nodulation protein NodZ [Betaproteobacteria bacterium]
MASPGGPAMIAGARQLMPGAHRFLSRQYRQVSAYATQARAVLALRAGRRPPGKCLVLQGAPYEPGLFSAFATVLGLLEYHERWAHCYSGVVVDFGTSGLYYERSAEPNWWAYYFEPIGSLPGRDADRAIVTGEQHFYFATRVERRMSRRRAFDLIRRHVRPLPFLREQMESVVREQFEGGFVVGVHYRGTDKFWDAPRVPFTSVGDAVSKAMLSAGSMPCKVYVATDEQGFLDYMRERFPGRVVCLEMHRSVDGTPIDVIQGDNWSKGRDAVLDCLLLSRCDVLVRTASNLGLCAGFFNPTMPVILLNRER